MSERTIHRFATPVELQRAAAVSIAKFLDEAVRLRGVATLCLSGGSTPKAVYELLANDQFPEWAKVHFFWGDERCVPPSHRESNFLMAKNALLDRLAIPDGNIHRIKGERPPAEAAQQYERELRNFFRLMENEMPRFDVTLLGLGEDGHTASLFRGTTILNETARLVADVYVEQFKAHRISLTYPVLNNSSVIMFLVSGSGKASILHEILEGAPGRFPAQKIQPSDGTLYWLVDEQASSHLTT